MKRVLVTEPIHEAGMSLLYARDDIEVIEAPNAQADTLAELMAEVDGVVVRTAEMTSELLSLSNKLKVVSRHGVGCDNLAVAHLSDRQIPVAIAAGANSSSVAELTLGFMLALSRRLNGLDAAVREDRFGDRAKLLATDLEGATLLIVGFGRVGRKVARRARAFEMNVIVADIALDHALAAELGCEAIENFKEALPRAEYLSLHIPLDDTTRHIISTDELRQLKQDAYLINCARGGIVDEAALLSALQSGQLAGAALDVFSVEPPDRSDPAVDGLLKREDVLLAPHAGAASQGAMREMARMAAQNVLDCFDGTLVPDNIFNAAELGLK